MKTYRRQNGERFERERNERAPRSVEERLALRGRRSEEGVRNFDVNEMRRGASSAQAPRTSTTGQHSSVSVRTSILSGSQSSDFLEAIQGASERSGSMQALGPW
jgi:hypothetical protein